MSARQQAVYIEEIADPVALDEARRQREQFDRNAAWLQNHVATIYAEHRGKFICISGEELFAGDCLADVMAQAKSAHPDDIGWFTRYIPTSKLSGVYAI